MPENGMERSEKERRELSENDREEKFV